MALFTRILKALDNCGYHTTIKYKIAQSNISPIAKIYILPMIKMLINNIFTNKSALKQFL
jgi:hypothetical protein